MAWLLGTAMGCCMVEMFVRGLAGVDGWAIAVISTPYYEDRDIGAYKVTRRYF